MTFDDGHAIGHTRGHKSVIGLSQLVVLTDDAPRLGQEGIAHQPVPKTIGHAQFYAVRAPTEQTAYIDGPRRAPHDTGRLPVDDDLGGGVEQRKVQTVTVAAVVAGHFEGSLTGDKSVSVVFDNSKLKRIVPDMKTNVSFDTGVRIALDYVLSHPECQIEDKEFDEWCDRVIDALEESKKKI